MTDRNREIECPCCGALIVLDLETGAILSHVAPKPRSRSFEEAAEQVKTGRRRAATRFDQALEERSHQSEILDRKFKQALEKAAEDPEPPPNPFENE